MVSNKIEWIDKDHFIKNRRLSIHFGLWRDNIFIIEHVMSGFYIRSINLQRESIYNIDTLEEAKQVVKNWVKEENKDEF